MAKIRVENVSKVFNPRSRNRNNVLKGVSFELPERGLVAIFGKSGSGKTTLLNIIGGLDKQSGGKIYIDGENVAGKRDKLRNEKIGFIFQNYYLERGYTISEILRNQLTVAGFRDEEEIAKRSRAALRLVDMERYKNKQGNALSGGQKQRVAIARALVKGADIILADEPTGNLDAENTVKVMEILKEISRTRLVVLVTHELTLIKKYADGCIKLVDGELVENAELEEGDLCSTYDAAVASRPCADDAQSSADDAFTFEKSGAKHNGRLFRLGSIFRAYRNRVDERTYSTANIVKQIFILAMAILMCFFAMSLFELSGAVSPTKPLSEQSLYLDLNAYSDLRGLDESLYDEIGFFETEYRSGSFSYNDVAALSNIEAAYSPEKIESGESFESLYGKMPQSGEVLITRALAQTLKKQMRLSELQNDGALLLLTFEKSFRVCGIVEGGEPRVYFTKADYVNFLGVYNSVRFSDVGSLFFTGAYADSSYTAEIKVYDGTLADDMAVIEINRNSLYLMMDDTTTADYYVQLVNAALDITPYAIQISDSLLYVDSFTITRSVMTTDVIIYVNEGVLGNVFRYLKPGLDSLNGQTASERSQSYYFEVTAEGEALGSLAALLEEKGVTGVNVVEVYARLNKDTLHEAVGGLYLFLIMVALLYVIYYFMEKSGSIANSREYGVLRAIGANRSNLLFKETVTTLLGNVLGYLLYFALVTALICVYYAVMNTSFTLFVLIALATFAVGTLLLLGVSLIPYLFVLWQTSSQILSRYDI